MNTAFGILANLADDLRHLQRTEVGELAEYFAEGQVGSSTMPHKRNPWNAEHVKSLWKTFAPRSMTWFMDQISEHQRDLSNSASGRFVVEFVAGFVAAAERTRRILERLHVDEPGIERNLRTGVHRVLAEPLYILLAAGGVEDAHEQLRRLTLAADESGRSILDTAREDEELWSTITDTYRRLTGGDPEAFFSDPANYTGRAAARTRAICATHRETVASMRDRLR
jgi:adenylosuccinate lyase